MSRRRQRPEDVDSPRIVHVLHALNGRAISEVASLIAGRMAHLGFEVDVVATFRTDEATPLPPGVGFTDLGGSPKRTLTSVLALRGALRRLGPTVVYAHGNGPARAAILATRMMRRRPRLIGIEHNHYSSYPWNHRKARDVVNRVLLPRADGIVGVSGGVVDDLEVTFPALRGKLHMVPEPLTRYDELDTLAAEPLDHPWFGERIPVITTVGHVHARKDHQTLVRAMGRVRDLAGPSAARLVIVGDDRGDEAVAVRRLIEELGLVGNVVLVGAQSNPLPFVAGATVFVLSSRNEGMGIAILEAMGLGVPVASTDCPSGPAWLLEDGACGLLVPVGDHVALGDALLSLLEDPELRARFGRSGITRAAAFAPDAITDRYLELASGQGLQRPR